MANDGFLDSNVVDTKWRAEAWSSGDGEGKTTCLPIVEVTSCDLG